MDTGAVHPLTGPVLVKGARPGDVLEIEMVDVLPQPHAFTAIVPGLGFLRDLYTSPVSGEVAHRRRVGHVVGAARRADSRRAVHGRDRRRALARSASRVDGARAGLPRARRAGHGARCRRRRPRQGAGGDGGAPHDLLRARTAATWTSSSSPRARRCRARHRGGRAFLGRATATSRRATARSASPRSRWAPPPWCASAC